MSRSLLVLYRRSPGGAEALAEAARLARVEGARMTVLSVALQERSNQRCCNIRSSYWNGVLRELADDALRDAADSLVDTQGVDFAVASGESLADVLAREAAERGCDLIVLPHRAHHWLPLRADRFARRLSRRTNCDVVELPAKQ